MTMMQSILPHIGKVNGTIAIEQELEAREDVLCKITRNPEGWTVATDGSLRYYGLEFKSTGPVDEKSLRSHIDTLHTSIKSFDWISNSPRTSVHYHVNILGHTPTQVYTAALAYWFLEDVFMSLCSPARKGNLFCLRLQDANGLGDLVTTDANNTINFGYSPFDQFRGDHYRYAGLNLNAVQKFGSLEARAMDGNLDADRIELGGKYLINLIHRIKQFKTPEELMNDIEHRGYITTAVKILGEDVAARVNLDVNLEESYERIADIGCSVDWSQYEEAIKKFDVKKKKKSAEARYALGENVQLHVRNIVEDNNILEQDIRAERLDDDEVDGGDA